MTYTRLTFGTPKFKRQPDRGIVPFIKQNCELTESLLGFEDSIQVYDVGAGGFPNGRFWASSQWIGNDGEVPDPILGIITITTDEARSGTQSLAYEFTTDDPLAPEGSYDFLMLWHQGCSLPEPGGLIPYARPVAEVSAGQDVDWSCWAKADIDPNGSIGNGPALQLDFYDSELDWISGGVTGVVADTTWTQYTRSLTAPSGAAYLTASFRFGAIDYASLPTFYLDDFTLDIT